MSLARDQLVGRIKAIAEVLVNPVSADTSPVATPSSSAVVVRNGCMVMLFCALEGFVRDRSLECANAIDQSAVPYTHLPEGLKVASVIATFEGLVSLTRGWSLVDKLAEFEPAVVAAASGSLGSPYRFTSYSFGRDKSNVNAGDLVKIAASFGVENLWNSMRTVCQKAGTVIPGNMDAVFKELAKKRHKAAHVPLHNVPHSELVAALPQAMTIALAFDTLVSAATNRLSLSSIASGTPPGLVSGADVDFMVIKPHAAGRWAAFLPNRTRALFVEATYDSALSRATAAARARGLSIVCRDATGRASYWKTVLG